MALAQDKLNGSNNSNNFKRDKNIDNLQKCEKINLNMPKTKWYEIP